MWNTKCTKCGHDAYVGLFGHISDCSNSSCQYHVSTGVSSTDPNSNKTATPTGSGFKTKAYLRSPSPAQQTALKQIQDQQKVAEKVAHFLYFYSGKLSAGYGQTNNLITPYNPIFNHFILAGGAPRNWHLGMPAKDLDFFIANDKFDPVDLEQNLKTIFGTNLVKFDPRIVGTYGFETHSFTLTDSSSPLIHEIQLINFDKYYRSLPEEVLNTFDFNINKIYAEFDPVNQQMKIVSTKEFEDDIHNKTLTFNLSTMVANRQYSSLKKIATRAKKFQSILRDYNIVIQ